MITQRMGTYSKTLQDFVYVPASSLAGGFLEEKDNVCFSSL